MLGRRPLALSLTTLLSLPFFALACGEDEKATPQVVFEGDLRTTSAPLDTAGGEKNCGEAGQLFTIGAFGNPALTPAVPSSPKKDGDSDQQGNVGVTCSVIPSGADEFTVSASASLTGATGGTFTIRQAKIKTTGENTGISATFSKRSGAGIVYSQSDGGCIVRFTTPFQGVAAGRVWGEIDCPKVTNANAQVACRAVAQFRFENCDQ